MYNASGIERLITDTSMPAPVLSKPWSSSEIVIHRKIVQISSRTSLIWSTALIIVRISTLLKRTESLLS